MSDRGPDRELVVLAAESAAAGFRLGGATTLVCRDGATVLDAVRQVAGRAAVIAIQDGLWSSVPGPTRAEWLRQTDPLVVRIPDPDHGVAAAHQAELRDLLARAVGFQITFDSEGSS